MDIKEIRKLIIQAIAADDVLMDLLVLKGGNALDIVHKLNLRTSLDIDFSIAGDFEDAEEIKTRLFKSLNDRFDSKGLAIFDEKFSIKPRIAGNDPAWGGYLVEFKLISKQLFNQYGKNTDDLRRRALAIGDPASSRIFRIEISKHEWVEGAFLSDLEGFQLRVYTLQMIAVEKLRALCQQMEEYPINRTRRPRSRDFFDIYTITNLRPGMWEEDQTKELVKAMFETKKVPLDLIEQISKTKEFHQTDWDAVRTTVGQQLEPFDFYFSFVVEHAALLKSLWVK